MPQPGMVVIQRFDKNSLGAIEPAIRNSDLGVNPANDGMIIRIVLPELTEERRREYIKPRAQGRGRPRRYREHRAARQGHAEQDDQGRQRFEDDVRRAERDLDELIYTA